MRRMDEEDEKGGRRTRRSRVRRTRRWGGPLPERLTVARLRRAAASSPLASLFD